MIGRGPDTWNRAGPPTREGKHGPPLSPAGPDSWIPPYPCGEGGGGRSDAYGGEGYGGVGGGSGAEYTLGGTSMYSYEGHQGRYAYSGHSTYAWGGGGQAHHVGGGGHAHHGGGGGNHFSDRHAFIFTVPPAAPRSAYPFAVSEPNLGVLAPEAADATRLLARAVGRNSALDVALASRRNVGSTGTCPYLFPRAPDIPVSTFQTLCHHLPVCAGLSGDIGGMPLSAPGSNFLPPPVAPHAAQVPVVLNQPPLPSFVAEVEQAAEKVFLHWHGPPCGALSTLSPEQFIMAAWASGRYPSRSTAMEMHLRGLSLRAFQKYVGCCHTHRACRKRRHPSSAGPPHPRHPPLLFPSAFSRLTSLSLAFFYILLCRGPVSIFFFSSVCFVSAMSSWWVGQWQSWLGSHRH